MKEIKLIDYQEDRFRPYFNTFLLKYKENKSLDNGSEEELWKFFRAGFKIARNEVLDIFDELNKGMQTERLG